MSEPSRFPHWVWNIIRRMNQRMVTTYGPKSKAAGRVLVLTSTGRKSGLQRHTPLQYEEVDGAYFVSSARGNQADWYHNLAADPRVEVKIGGRSFSTTAELITDPEVIVDHMALRQQRHPRFMGLMLRLEGLPARPCRDDLRKVATRLTIVKLPGQKPDLTPE